MGQFLRVQEEDVREWVSAAGYNPHDIIQGYVQRFGMRASAPYWSGILCAAVNNCKGCCLDDFSICTTS